MPVLRCWRFFALSLALAVPSMAHAQSTPRATSAETERRARELFTQGQNAFVREDYSTAAARFEEAFALSPQAVLLLYNLGVTYDRLQMPQQALDAYTHYLQRAPSATERQEVEERIRVLRAEADIDRERQEGATNSARIVSERVVYRDAQVVQEPARGWRTAGIVLGSVAGVGALVTVGVGLFADRHFQMLRRDCGDLRHDVDPDASWCSRVQVDDIQLRGTLFNALLFGTIGVGIATGVAFTIDATRQRSVRTVRVPSGSPGPVVPTTPSTNGSNTVSAIQFGVLPTRDGATLIVGGRF